MKSLIITVTLMTFAGAAPAFAEEFSSFAGTTLSVMGDPADALYEKLTVKEVVNDTDQIALEFIKNAQGISCTRHMNGSSTECVVQIDAAGVVIPKH